MATGNLPRASEPESREIAWERDGPRVAARYEVGLYSSGFDGPLPATSRDLGPAGVCVQTRSMFAFRCLHRISVRLPGGSIGMEAKGRWQRFSESDDGFVTGIAFENAGSAELRRLWDLTLEERGRLARFLCEIPELSRLRLEELMSLCRVSRIRRSQAGSRVFSAGTDASQTPSTFIVRKGCLVLEIGSHDTRSSVVHRVSRGGLVSGPFPSDGSVFTVSARVEEDCELLEITPAAHRHLRAAYPRASRRLARAVDRNLASWGLAAERRPPELPDA